MYETAFETLERIERVVKQYVESRRGTVLTTIDRDTIDKMKQVVQEAQQYAQVMVEMHSTSCEEPTCVCKTLSQEHQTPLSSE